MSSSDLSVIPNSSAISHVPSRWLTLLCAALAGYAFFGKGFAYLGLPPMYVGEFALACGLVWLVLRGRWCVDNPIFWPLLGLGIWGMARTLPYVSRYGMDALRDAAIWGYGAFAIIVFSYLVADPRRLPLLLRRYRSFSIAFLWLMPVIWFVHATFADRMPLWPWSETPVIHAKGGDVLVHYAGILAFWVVGLGGRKLTILHAILIAIACAMVGVDNRAGLLSFILVFAICFFCYPFNRTLWQIIGVGICGLTVLVVTNARFELDEGSSRNLSAEQLISNVQSMVADTDRGELENTKKWRLQWWNKIVGYTVDGPLFLTGKGFGIDLAADDGFQGTMHEKNRSPHNGHLNVLARAGVPGFLLWLLVHVSWAGVMCCALFSSRRSGETGWSSLFMFLLLYWFAMMVNASFDVYLEGPMGGIWLWTIYGVGLAAFAIYRRHPETLFTDKVERAR